MNIDIINEGGMDLDVLINLRLFYCRYGRVRVFESERKKSADLLVIMRCKSLSVYLELGCPLHIYDYSKTIDTDPLIGIQSTQATLMSLDKDLIFELCGSGVKSIYSYHPVDVRFWISGQGKTEHFFQMLHIGNHKITQMDDRVQSKFNEYVIENNVTIYGQNWDAILPNMGPIPFNAVSSLYAKSKFAIGVMYQYQRFKTLSSRMWLGPINGCTVITEALPKGLDVPGVIVSDFEIESITRARDGACSGNMLAMRARIFWNQEKHALTERLGFGSCPERNFSYIVEFVKAKMSLSARAAKFYVTRWFTF